MFKVVFRSAEITWPARRDFGGAKYDIPNQPTTLLRNHLQMVDLVKVRPQLITRYEFILDHRGVIRHKWIGHPGAKTIDAALEKLIEQAIEFNRK